MHPWVFKRSHRLVRVALDDVHERRCHLSTPNACRGRGNKDDSVISEGDAVFTSSSFELAAEDERTQHHTAQHNTKQQHESGLPVHVTVYDI